MLELEQWCQIARETLPWDWGFGMVPISRFGSALRPCSFRYFALRTGLSMMSVGPFLLLNQPLWLTLDHKELFNRLHGSVCADHGMRYTGWQLRVELASSASGGTARI